MTKIWKTSAFSFVIIVVLFSMFRINAFAAAAVTNETELRNAIYGITDNTPTTIMIANDITLTDTITINGSRNISFKTVGGPVTLTSANKFHFTVINGNSACSYTFDGVILDGKGASGGFFVYGNTQSVEINGITLRDISRSEGGALYSTDCPEMVINNPTVTNCVNVNQCGGIYLESAGVSDFGTAIINGGTFTGCENKKYGGGAILAVNKDLTVNNCTFIGNKTPDMGNGSGGAIKISVGSLTANNCTFTGNMAGHSGGAIYQAPGINWNTSDVTINDCVFTDNKTSASLGGAIFSQLGRTVFVQNCKFSNNAGNGGAIGIDRSNELIIDSCSFNSNTSPYFGGAIHYIFATSPFTGYNLTVTGGTSFTSNTADLDGGAIFLSDPLMPGLHINGGGNTVVFDGNTASAVYTIKGDPAAISAHDSAVTGSYTTSITPYLFNNYDISFTAGVPVDFFTVTFDSMGGSGVANQVVASGEKVVKPADPVKDEYVFTGWYRDKDYTSAWDFAHDTVTSDITLYAKWEIEKMVLPPTLKTQHPRYIYGYPDDSVSPDRNLTRAEAATIIYRLIEAPDKHNAILPISSDIIEGSWYYHEAAYVENSGIMPGFADGTFRPNNPLTGAEFMSIISALETADISKAESIIDAPEENIVRWKAVFLVNSITDREIDFEGILLREVRYRDLPTTHPGYGDIMEASHEDKKIQ